MATRPNLLVIASPLLCDMLSHLNQQTPCLRGTEDVPRQGLRLIEFAVGTLTSPWASVDLDRLRC